MLPTLGGIISNPDPHPTIMVDGAIDLVTLVLAPSPPEVVQQIHAAATPHVLKLLMHHNDAEILRSATAYLRTLLQAGAPAHPARFLRPGGPVLRCAARTLR